LEGKALARLRVLARHRPVLAAVVLALPALLVVTVDAVMRGQRLVDFPPKYLLSYGAAFLESAVLWAVLLGAASARRGAWRWIAAALFVTLATIAVGGQLYFYRQYSTYLNLDATLFGTSMADSLFGQLEADGKNFALSVVPTALVAVALVWLGRTLVRTRRRPAQRTSALGAGALAGVLLIPCSYRSVQGSTPDVIYFHAVGGLLKQLTGIVEHAHVRPGLRTPPVLPTLVPAPGPPRNVLFVLTESVRHDLVCSSPSASCPVAPFTNEALPARLGLEQMRSNSSTTAIELAVLWSGLQPTAGRQALHSAPLLFDYAHAAGRETAYWTSHHMMFANSRLYVQDLPTRFQCGATHLDPLADIDTGADDRLLTARVTEELPLLREPFFAVVHYGNTHVPYLVDPDDAPFQPARASKGPEDNEAYRRYFHNAVRRQDRTVADLLRFVRGLEIGERTVIVYTSDHGEQFREHGQLGHTGSLFEVEIHVPAWVDAPAGALSDAERAALVAHREAATFHTDLTPTMLDLMGIWDADALAPFRRAMVGASLLRPERPDTVLEMTNCAGVWGCAFENWGAMRGFDKVLAREWDSGWLCYDVRVDPTEQNPRPLDDCANLVHLAEQAHGRLPGR
jgi:glucan phosphoethanolaminetransferase (alkaline phosphatase superfamily)